MFQGNPQEISIHPDLSLQVIRVFSESFFSKRNENKQVLGFFHLQYNDEVSPPLTPFSTSNDVRIALERLSDVVAVHVEKGYSALRMDDVLIDAIPGSSLVRCSISSSCNFGEKGLHANDLIRVEDLWFRVSSSYDGDNNEFHIARVDNSVVYNAYSGGKNVLNAPLYVWSGGFEWKVTFHETEGILSQLSSPKHNLLPFDSVVEISTDKCKRCAFASGLSKWKLYYIRSRFHNALGWSPYSTTISDIPRSIPEAPTNMDLRVISGKCLEVTFSPPLIPGDKKSITSYLIEWDDEDNFTKATDKNASCSSVGFGNCLLSSFHDSSPIQHEICNLHSLQVYHVRVAAINSVPAQSIYPSDLPIDNTKWSTVLQAKPIDQTPDPPKYIRSDALGRSSLQIVFEEPARHGGKDITAYKFEWDVENSFSNSFSLEVPSSSINRLNSNGPLIYNFEVGTFDSDILYYIRIRARNEVGFGFFGEGLTVAATSSPVPPMYGDFYTIVSSNSPNTEAMIEWSMLENLNANEEDPVTSFLVEWWSNRVEPEIQVIRLQSTIFSDISNTTFSLSFSSEPHVKRETSMMSWNASPDIVRRELLNLGWGQQSDALLLKNIEVSRITLTNGYAWSITYGSNTAGGTNNGDQVALVARVAANGDATTASISTTTIQDGKRSLGQNEVQILQIAGTGILSGFYRLKFESSEYSVYISVHANAQEVKSALEQLSTISEVEVKQENSLEHAEGYAHEVKRYYTITFLSNPGNVGKILVDSDNVSSSNHDAIASIYDGDNSLNLMNMKRTDAIPGERPCDYHTSASLEKSARSYKIHGLVTGRQYFVAVSARSSRHGLSHRMIPNPSFVIPPMQRPTRPTNVSLTVNTGYSDSLLLSFEPPISDGGEDISRYRVELDPTSSFDDPIVDTFECPTNNRRTIWKVETKTSGGAKIVGGSFTLLLELNGFSHKTSNIPYNAVPLRSNETGLAEELSFQFEAFNGTNFLTSNSITNLDNYVFKGDRLRFNSQISAFKFYEVKSVNGKNITLTEPFYGSSGVQNSTIRYYGGRGDPSTSRIHCQVDAVLCPISIANQSGSIESKLIDLKDAIQKGVLVDRDGPREDNSFVWRITFLDDSPKVGSDFKLSLSDNFLTADANIGSASVLTTLIRSGETFTKCSGDLVVPKFGGLVKGLEYFARVFAVNSEGYSLPRNAMSPKAPMIQPGPPTGVTLDVISANELRVMFGPPSDNGGDTITQYLIEWSIDSLFSSPDSDLLEYLSGGAPFFKTISGLSTGISYYLRVSAKNSQGYGISQASTPNFLNPHQTPSIPTKVLLLKTSDTMLTVSWNDPTSDGGDKITQYRVEWDTSSGFTSGSKPPHKGFADVEASSQRSYTIDLLSSAQYYFVRVFAINSSGLGSPQNTSPRSATPEKQVPGYPHSLIATSGVSPKSIDVSWLAPRVPNHGYPCSGTRSNPMICPTSHGHMFPSSDGGDAIVEYEVEYNEHPNFSGNDGGRKLITSISCTLSNLTPGRTYFIRVLARNSIGSGPYCELEGSDFCDGARVSTIAAF